VLPATILGSSLTFIDSSVINVALPAIQRGLVADFATTQWLVNGYLLALASLILVGGSASDRFGRRRVFLIGLIAFAGASLACALAPSALWLVGARIAQGVAAALLTPASLAIIGAAYGGDARGPAIGTWAAAGALTTALGPLLGGWLVEHIGWRAIFFINLPIAAAALLLGLELTADRSAQKSEPLDVRGAALTVVTLGTLSYGLIALGEGSGTTGVVAVALAVPATWLFIRTEARSVAPMMPLPLFRNREFSGANALTVFLYAALSGALFLLPFMLIRVHGYTATAAGAAFLPFSAIMGLGSRWAGRLIERLGSRLLLVVGPSAAAAGYMMLGLSAERASYRSGLLPGLTVLAIGMTLSVAPLTTTVFNTAPVDKSGTASGINSAAARAGGLLAVAGLGLAFGNTDATVSGAEAITIAYRLVMFGAAGLAALAACAAALTLGSRDELRQKKPVAAG
jgi:EmrB/QacA subfamily drug resistance transporter